MLILASSSPRRRQLLADAGLDFETVPSPAEELHDASIPPGELCEINAALKARAVAGGRPADTVIGADTLVFLGDEPLGKPAHLDEARQMLRRLAGRVHTVCTGVCVIHPDGSETRFHEKTEVRFRPLTDQDIEAYLRLTKPLDKAGAYGIQDRGELIVESIQGAFDNVMGLPVAAVAKALADKSGCGNTHGG